MIRDSSNGDSQYSNNKWKDSGCEIEEVEESSSEVLEINSGVQLPTIKEEMDDSLFSFDFHNSGDGEDVLYVAVGKTDSSMDALLWTLNHAHAHSNTHPTLLFLIHVFPQLRFIKTPYTTNYYHHLQSKQRKELQASESCCSNQNSLLSKGSCGNQNSPARRDIRNKANVPPTIAATTENIHQLQHNYCNQTTATQRDNTGTGKQETTQNCNNKKLQQNYPEQL
ncbi:hypothetical protein U1Q18_008726 [Sarracenia purpurea var. burkii]